MFLAMKQWKVRREQRTVTNRTPETGEYILKKRPKIKIQEISR